MKSLRKTLAEKEKMIKEITRMILELYYASVLSIFVIKRDILW